MTDKKTASILTIEGLRQYSKPDRATMCWNWTGPTCKQGYPHIVTLCIRSGLKRRLGATSAVWNIAHDDPIPAGNIAARTCANTRCVNPAHIKLARNRREALASYVRAGVMQGTRSAGVTINHMPGRESARVIPTEKIHAIFAFPESAKNTDIARELGMLRSTVAHYRARYRRGINVRGAQRQVSDEMAQA
jgi:hypothetical protein